MLEYLVSSTTRRRLLEALWKDRARGTVSSVARLAGVPVGASYGELKAMCRAGLAREALESGRLVYEAEWSSPYAAAIKQLVSPPSRPIKGKASTKSAQEKRWDVVRTELTAQGAPLWSRLPNVVANTPLEELFAMACALSHHDPSVAKVLPYLFLRKKDELRFDSLEKALTEHKQKHTAGFFLAAASALWGDETVRQWSERLRDNRRTKPIDFFGQPSSARLQALAERNTPALARAWHFRLNMTMEDFRSVMKKHPLDEHLSG